MSDYTNKDVVNILMKEIKKLREDIEELKGLKNSDFEHFDPTEYINYPLNQYKKLYRYKGEHYSQLKKLYDAAGGMSTFGLEYKQFYNKTTYDERLLRGHNVNIVFAAPLKTGHLITTDGILLKANLDKLKRAGREGSYYRITLNGEKKNLNPDVYVYREFVDRSYNVMSGTLHLDGDVSNCRIDNLEKRISKEEINKRTKL